ncbi:hypothetical protein GCM10017673_38680 [Streptosporangium violaceochromogenes]|nr:hypothetical protein GCM10017673_38680 [Streptosporangium violaceochromogenes]
MPTTPTAPAEIVRPGRAVQRVNAYTSDGVFERQVRFHGTEDEARAYVKMLATHR